MKKIIRFISRLNKSKWRRDYEAMLQKETAAEKFKLIYEKNLWRNAESASGSGSTLKFTRNIRASLPGLVSKYGIKSIFDAPCGDFHWMKHALKSLDVQYLGGDIVAELVEANQKAFATDKIAFMAIDLIQEPFPATDLMLCRDCLFHLSYKDTLAILRNFVNSNTAYLYTTTYRMPPAFANQDIATGNFRAVDLTKPPYHFPDDALYCTLDGKKNNTERFMCLWDRSQILSAVDSMSTDLERGP